VPNNATRAEMTRIYVSPLCSRLDCACTAVRHNES
jgi:hypothetical protein